MGFSDMYSGQDVFAGRRGHQRRNRPAPPKVPATPDVVAEDPESGFVGLVVGFEKNRPYDLVQLEDRRGKVRLFEMRPGAFLIDGQEVTLVRPKKTPPDPRKQRTASGSRAVANATAKIALPSRIWVEGIHDAEIVERVWGDDLRVEGVVVEHLEGLDNLAERLAEFQPGPGRRVGVLADHLVTGSKEMRMTQHLGPHVMVTGHPYIDIWEAVKPAAVGIKAWPKVPKGQDWKTGVCAQLGWADPTDGWRKVRSSVHSFRDLEPTLLQAVEQLIDFVTVPPNQ
ncbi:DUF3097 domain-containing protein [Corynebacterium sp. TAE3-ERU12]|uniref:DUF3097 domain-containing protein n=1 Tax=Corynebacterium sp. TAE3-ERU12 TaxID=2849491 RepID=UPI001C4815FE|nr:DUF3097 domain-containing protein [Corynebacterium sp. TAE3-ERU12]MBV7295446.1 DUF3097 domain-containing protein [Corynebacterium sp. TAE3-ERU12]